MRSIATDWYPFARADTSTPVALLERILGHTSDAFVVLEPMPQEQQRQRFGARKSKSASTATLSPFAEDDHPHILAYLTFPKGDTFSRRGFTLPPWVELDDESKDDVTWRAPIWTSPTDVIGLAIAVLDRCSPSPLGDAWRTAIGDTYVAP